MDYRVVIIDDEAWTRDTIKRIGNWQEYGFQMVGEAADGVSGIECIKQLKPHLIITDMKMPGIDGAELLQLLSQQNIKTKVIVISGYYEYNYTRQALNSRVMDYLLKPIKEDEFNRLIKRCSDELDRETLMEEQNEISLVGIADTSWLTKYIEARDDTRKCLEGLSKKGVRCALDKMKALLEQQKDDRAKLKLVINMNYDLHKIVEETVIAKYNAAVDRSFAVELPFTIRESGTHEEFIRHYTDIADKIIDEVNLQRQRKNKIDILAIKQFVDNNFSGNISLEELAKTNFVTKEYLSSAFKKELGMTFSDYLTRVRMEKAKELIVEYGLPIQAVSDMTGYLDIAHFYKTFKKYFGTSPGKMR